jgi:hypothetical protein
MSNKNPSRRDPSCDFNDIEEGDGHDIATPVNQSINKMDVESLLKKSKETRDRIKHNIDRGSIRDSTGNKDSEIVESKQMIDVSKSVPLDSRENLHEILHADVEVKQITHQFKNQRTVKVDLKKSDPKPRFIQDDASPKYANMVSESYIKLSSTKVIN